MSVDPKVLQSIVNLRANSDFQVFVEYLRSHLEQLKETALYSNTGEASLLKTAMARSINDVVKTIDTAPTFISQLKRNI